MRIQTVPQVGVIEKLPELAAARNRSDDDRVRQLKETPRRASYGPACVGRGMVGVGRSVWGGPYDRLATQADVTWGGPY